jgi:MFS family permease
VTAAALSAAQAATTRWSIASIFFLNGFVFAAWVPHIPELMDRHALSTGQLGSVLLAMAAGAMCALPFAGGVASRFGSRAVTTVCALAFCVMLPLPVLAPSAALAAVALFVFGALNATLDVAMNAQGAELEMRMQRPIMSSLHGAFSLGGLAGAGSAAALLEAGMSSTAHVLCVAVLTGLAVLIAARGLLPTSARRTNIRPSLVLPSRALLGLGALTFAALLIEGAMGDWTAVYLRREVGMDAGGAALGFAAFSLTMAACRFAGDAITHRFGAVPLVRFSALIALSGLLIALLFRHPLPALTGFALVGIGMANLIPILFGTAARSRPADPGAGIAAVATTGYTGFLVGPPLIGWLADYIGLTLAMGVLVLLCAGIALATPVISHVRQRSVTGS